MISKYVKEQKRYTQDELKELFECGTDEVVLIIRKLKEYGIVKNVKKSSMQNMLSDLAERDVCVTDINVGEENLYYVFSFVGVIVIYGRILKCYPKYINSCNEPIIQMKQILRVLEHYNSKEQVIKFYNADSGEESFNLLAVMLYLLEDYHENGIYINNIDIIETNGSGEVLWDRTINETFSYIFDNRPYYAELQTKKRISDEYNFIRRLHECILTIFSKELEQSDLAELFNIATVNLSEEMLEEFGDDEYILYRIQTELNVQYNTRKQSVLKAMYAIVEHKAGFDGTDSFSLYGTNSFNLVWEKVCAANFGNSLNKKLSDLPLGVSSDYILKKDDTLIEIIDRPVWYKFGENIYDDESETLRPDLISIYKCNDSGEYCFGIFDAKYYCINFDERASGYKVMGQPGVGDITKQYLYQLAYDDFIIKQGYKYVQNVFLCPDEVAEKKYGWVRMNMLHQIGDKKLEDIAVVKLCAPEMYKIYLSDQIIDENEINRYIPEVGRRKVENQNIVNRRATYLAKITSVSEISEEKINMKVDKGSIIYPKQVRRDLGAKLIYDLMCSTACKVLYGFNPYVNREYDNMAAEDSANAYIICSQIADASIEIEKSIKNLSDQKLKDEKVLKKVLRKVIKDKCAILSEEKYLEILEGKMSELVKELYL